MENPTCGDCIYFYQHYVYFLQKRFEPAPCGHCINPRIKHRKPTAPACANYRLAPQKNAEEQQTAGK